MPIRDPQITIKARDLTAQAFADVQRRLREIDKTTGQTGRSARGLGDGFRAILGPMVGMAAGIGIVRGLGAAFRFSREAALGMNATLETSTLQFATLMGDADRAREHVLSLFEFAKKTPFETGPIIEASRMLQTFGRDALNTKANLELIGDASAATGAPINELGFWVGRLFTSLQAGKPFGEAAMRLSELAVLTPEARNQMEALQKSGASAEQIFSVFQESLGQFTGAMIRQSKTWEGLTSTISDSANIIIADAMKPLFETAKEGLGIIADMLGSEGVQGAAVGVADALNTALGADKAARAATLGKAIATVAEIGVSSADLIVRAWSFVSLMITGTASVVMNLASAFTWVEKVASSARSRLAPWSNSLRLAALQAQETHDVTRAMATSLHEQAEAALDGVTGNTQFQKSLQALKAELQTTAARAAEMAAAAGDDLPPAANRAGAAFQALAGESKDLEKALKDAKKAQDEILGRDKLDDLRALQRAWDTLTPAQQRNHLVVQRVVKAYGDLRKDLAPELLPREFEQMWSRAQLSIPVIEGIGNAIAHLHDQLASLRDVVDVQEGFTALDNLTLPGKIDLGDYFEGAAEAIRPKPTLLAALRQDFGQIILGAIQGGGNIAQSVTGSVGASLARGVVGKFSESFGKSFLGSTLSSILPGLGALIGPLGSAFVGLFKKPGWKDTLKTVGRDWGVSISEGLAKSIEQQAKDVFRGDRRAAELFNLDKILSEAGGLTDSNVGKLTGKLRDVFVMLETGKFSVEQTRQVLDQNFSTFAQHLTRDGRLATAQFREIIQLHERLGVRSGAVAEFVSGQMAQVAGGISTFLENAKISSQASADAIGGSIAAVFANARERLGTPGALNEIAPLLEQFDKRIQEAGLGGVGALGELRSQVALLKDEVAGPALTAIGGLGQALRGLHNSGQDVSALVGGLASQIGATLASLEAEGKGGEAALRIVASDLQLVWEMQRDFGLAVDETTQKYLTQAEELDLVGEKHRSWQGQLIDGITRVATAVEGVAQVFGVTLPRAIDKGIGEVARSVPEAEAGLGRLEGGLIDVESWLTKTGSSVEDFVDQLKQIPRDVGVNIKVKTSGSVPVPTEGGDGIETEPIEVGHASGGLVRRRTRAVLGEGNRPELVGPVSFMSEALAGALNRFQSRSRATRGIAYHSPEVLADLKAQVDRLVQATRDQMRTTGGGADVPATGSSDLLRTLIRKYVIPELNAEWLRSREARTGTRAVLGVS